MKLRIKLTHVLVGIVAGALLAGGGYALASTQSRVIHACVNTKTRALTLPASGRCSKGSAALAWNQRGPKGAAGTKGAAGAAGAKGAAGAAGTSATVSVGSVTTEPAGSQASVTNSGTANGAVLNFGIPQGATGQSGTNGTDSGPTAYGQVWMGSGINSAELATGSNNANVEGVGGGDGTAVVGVNGCSAEGLAEPVIDVTADADPDDPLTGRNSAGTAAAYITGWSVSDSVLNFDVSTYDPIDKTAANSDFSFTVYC